MTLTIFCDESGHTGPNLLAADQRLFTFSASAVDDAEAYEILAEARAKFPVQMPELKANALLKTDKGVDLIHFVLDKAKGRFRAVAYDKLLALAGKLFEYIYEPVLQDNPGIVYQKDLHRFVAMYCYIFFDDDLGGTALREFERYMRTLDPASAPCLFDPPALRAEEAGHPFAMVPTFSRACRELIVADNLQAQTVLPDEGKWLLDLAVSSLWSLLLEWSPVGEDIRVICDDSKPLRAQAESFSEQKLAFALERATALMPDRKRRGFKLAEPVAFRDSGAHSGLQIADLVAGSLSKVLAEMMQKDRPPREDLAAIAELVLPAMSNQSVLPDESLVDLNSRPAAVNWSVLQYLADEAIAGRNPRRGLEAWYHGAEVSYARGDFKAIQGE